MMPETIALDERRAPAALLLRGAAGCLLFAAGYILINYRNLVSAVLYRAAAHDIHSAAIALGAFALQALALLLLVALCPRRLAPVLLALVALSAFVNICYATIVRDTIDAAKLAWLFEESRQAGAASREFLPDLAISIARTGAAVLLLAGARHILAPLARGLRGGTRSGLFAVALLAPFFAGLNPLAGERNVYAYAAAILTAPPPPARDAVPVAPAGTGIEKIVWLIDESVSRDAFEQIVRPEMDRFAPVDFGETASLGNCSGPSNLALRSGIDVRAIGPATDLRRSPTIWGFARKAGYRTMLIDGQVTGAPQNMIIPTERVLIDDYLAASHGIDTDRRIARRVNAELRRKGRQFIYVVLRGVHFQYSDHYPAGTIPDDSPLALKYRTAVAWSKRDVFQLLLDGIDRERVAIVYTSDHGQDVRPDHPPHCNAAPRKAEFAIPLVALLPDKMAADLASRPAGGHSASQIFPTTLGWMGYPAEWAARHYDNDLGAAAQAYVWLGRSALPTGPGTTIEVHRPGGFPGS
jgi:hypothetical protein